MALSIGRQGQLYTIAEVTFGTVPALAVTNAIRHMDFKATVDKSNKRTIVEKKQSSIADVASRTNQRIEASYTLQALLRPSGTLNTLPECAPILLAGFGSVTNVSQTATVMNSGDTPAEAEPTTTVFAVTDVGSWVVGDAILIPVSGVNYVRWITTITAGAGSAPIKQLTVAPALPAAPANDAEIKGCVTYKITSALAQSLAFAHYLKKTDGSTAGLKRAISGAIVESLSLAFDANSDPMLTASGGAKDVVDGTDAPSQPAGFTMVGGQPPSGLSGDLYINDTALKFLKLGVDVKNALMLRNESYGYASAEEVFRSGRQEISLSIEMRYDNDAATLYDATMAESNVAVMQQTGRTAGNIIAIYAPQVEFKVPNLDDPDDMVNAPYAGMALESADGQNDALYIALA